MTTFFSHHPLKPKEAIVDKTLDPSISSADQMITLRKPELEQVLPHRGNALLIERVDIFPSQGLAIGLLRFAAAENDPVFTGHFPDNPIMPGHWLVEFASLTCAVLFTVSSGIPITGTTGVRIVGLDGCRFLSEVHPWTALTCTAKLVKHRNSIAVFRAMIGNTYTAVCRIEKLTGMIVKERTLGSS
ncbi:MAG: hypothetical protein WBB68_01575 [Candidatus Moraniibacteriota bacterium]